MNNDFGFVCTIFLEIPLQCTFIRKFLWTKCCFLVCFLPLNHGKPFGLFFAVIRSLCNKKHHLLYMYFIKPYTVLLTSDYTLYLAAFHAQFWVQSILSPKIGALSDQLHAPRNWKKIKTCANTRCIIYFLHVLEELVLEDLLQLGSTYCHVPSPRHVISFTPNNVLPMLHLKTALVWVVLVSSVNEPFVCVVKVLQTSKRRTRDDFN